MFSKDQIIHIASKLRCLFPNMDIDGNIFFKKSDIPSQGKEARKGKLIVTNLVI